MVDTDNLAQSNLELLRAELPDRYQDLKPLAIGGMGVLFIARDTVRSRWVAVKMLPPTLHGDDPEEVVKRFLREARAIARLSHPYIISIYEVGPGKRVPYFVMEFVEGETLGAFLAKIHQVDIERHLRIVVDICDALSHAHQKGVIHRDVKPENIFILPQGGIKLFDFGLAKTEEGSRITKTGQIMGTPVYMAPEQLQGDHIDQRADIYSVGVILYQLLTLALPFQHDQFYSKIYKPPDPPSTKNPDISPALDAVILRALSVDPEQRQPSADDLKWELSACIKNYSSFRDIPLMGEDWKNILKSDLERLSVEATRMRERVVLVEGEVRDVTLLVVRMDGLFRCQEVIAREGIGFVRDRTFRIVANEVERYGGCVDRYEVDGLVAHFGSRSATEVDCERAVLAGQGILEKISALNTMLSPRGITFQVGVGIDLARITVGREEKVDSGCFQIVRDISCDFSTGLWVTEPVRRRIAESFVVKGGPKLFAIVDRSPRIRAGERRPDAFKKTPFIGREVQIQDLETFFAQAAAQVNPGPGTTLGVRRTRPTLVGVRGEPGIGKSRLVHEFVKIQTSKGCAPALKGSTISFLKSPFFLLAGLVRRWLGVTESTPPSMVRDLLVDRLGRMEVLTAGRRRAVDMREPLMYLLGLSPDRADVIPKVPSLESIESMDTANPDPDFAEESASPRPKTSNTRDLENSSLQFSILQAVCDLILLISMDTQVREVRPQIIVLEDIQWVDELSHTVIESLLTSGDAGLFILCTYRPPHEPPERWKRFATFHLLPLDRLKPHESSLMVKTMLGGRHPGSKLMDLIVRRAGGNPYFLEETVNLLIDERALVQGPNGWEVSVSEESLSVPGTIQALVLSRFDLLPQDEKELLRVCSVIGIDVDGAILEEMARRLWGDAHDVRTHLTRLETMQFLSFREVQGRYAYSFRHSLAREVMYSTILASNLRVLHGLAARTIEKIYRGTLDDQSALLAYHCKRSDEPARALHYTELALKRAVLKYDHEGTLALASDALRLLSLIGDDPARRFDVLAMREKALEVAGRREEQRQDLSVMLDLATKLGDERRLSDVQNRLSWFYWWNVGDYARAHQFAVLALETKRRLKDQHGEADSFRNVGCVNSLLGNYDEALRAHRRARGLYHASGDLSGVAASVCSIAITLAQTGQIAEALQAVQEALELDQKIGDRRGVGRELRTLGDLHRSVGDDEKALDYYERALANDREIGYRQGEASNLACLGTIWLNQSKSQEALERFKDAKDLAMAINYRPLLGEIFLGMSVANRERGEVSAREVALMYAQNAYDLGEEMGIAGLTVMGISTLAFTQLLLGRTDEAVRLSTRAVSFLRGGPLPNVRPEEVWFNHSLIMNKTGNRADARSALERAYTLVVERASRIVDKELRRGFLRRVALNQRILIAWKHLPK